MTREEDKASPGSGGFEDLLLNDTDQAKHACLWMLTLEGQVENVNATGEAFSGVSNAEARHRDWRAFWPEESRFSVDRAIAIAAAGQVAKFRTFCATGEKSRTYWETLVSPVLDANQAPVSLVAISNDVTREVEISAFLGTVIQSLPSPLTVKTIEDGRYVLWNRAAEVAFGIETDDAMGKTAADLFGETVASAFEAADVEALRSGETHVAEGLFVSETLGRVYDAKTLATFDDAGPRHLIRLGEDVTERRAQALALRLALEDAERASRAKSTFLANMSHELRTPMNGIVAGADLLAKQALGPQAGELVDIIRASSLMLDRLLADILDLAQIEAGQMTIDSQSFHVGDLLRSVLASSRLGLGGKPVDLILALDPSLDAEVIGDPTRLRQVIVNLLGNAIKFTEAGSITLTGERDPFGGACFCVADTGIGFDDEEKARIFERFQQADASITRRFGGSGLGLAIARELVAGMGGLLECDGALGAGAKFWFTLPLSPSVTQPANPSEDVALGADRAMRVLVADDHPTNRRIVELMLAESADVICVENGREAVEAFLTDPVDIVLMDVQMPVMDGLSAVREIRRLEAEGGLLRSPIIMLTANAGDEHVLASQSAGADLHIQKPITAAALFSALNTVLEDAQQGEAACG